MIETIATVQSNLELAPGYRRLIVEFEQDIKARAGQFAMLKAAGVWEPLLRRALAIYQTSGPRQASFLYQVLGRGTEALSRLDRGARVEALLPLGNSWIEQEPPRHGVIVVSGGIGSASVLMLCEHLAKSGVDASVLFGAANKSVAAGCGLRDFEALNLPVTITTDDGSLGERGFVTAPLERMITDGVAQQVYACGPWVMMKRVAEISAHYEIPCLVSLEAPMGCGFGVCVGCVVAVRREGPLGYDSYKRVCTDGPVFAAETVNWDVNAMGAMGH